MTLPSAAALAIRRRIAIEGPLTVAAFMAEALAHPSHGYYATRDPFGTDGDFTTAPEISQVFGELVGLWCADVWRRMGSPERVLLVELGPGRGTLMADALRAARVLPAFRSAVRVHLVETSPVLRSRQARTLHDVAVGWHEALDGVPDGPALIIANEFFDALPIRQFERLPSGWHERRVTWDEPSGTFRFALDPLPSVAAALIPEPVRRDAPPGAVAEMSPAGRAVARLIGERLVRFGGAALVIDYGYDHPAPAETLQAVRRHAPVAVLDVPGEADLTAHVCFASLMRAAGEAGAVAHGPVAQGAFLARLGIAARVDRLCRSATPEQRAAIISGAARLVEPTAMGSLFRVLALTAPGLLPSGFHDDGA